MVSRVGRISWVRNIDSMSISQSFFPLKHFFFLLSVPYLEQTTTVGVNDTNKGYKIFDKALILEFIIREYFKLLRERLSICELFTFATWVCSTCSFVFGLLYYNLLYFHHKIIDSSQRTCARTRINYQQ